MVGDGGGSARNGGVYASLSPRNQERLSVILAEHVPNVITADRVIEKKTGYASEICRTMLVDVLAHLGTLAESQDDFSDEQGASQLAKIEEHLRRAIIEHPEEVLRDRIADVEELWTTYQRVAFSFREAGEMHGVPRHAQLETLRHRIDVLMDSARQVKPSETSWEESLTAAAQMTEAADLASDLADQLNQCIGKAQQLLKEEHRERRLSETHKKDAADTKRRWLITIAVSVLIAAFTLVGGYLLGHGAKKETVRVVRVHSDGK